MEIKVPKILELFGGTQLSNLKRIMDNRIKRIHTTTIGVIESFDAENQTAVVQPAIKRVVLTEDQDTITYTTENCPLLVNVPVVFPGGGDWFMTFPVKKGDECLIHSMERSIGNWKKNGGIQEPSNYKRKLSFKDAIAMVGIQSKASSLPSFNADEPELRNRAGDVFLTMTDDGINLMGDADNAVRFSALETAYNQLKQDFDSFVSTVYGAHTHTFTGVGSGNQGTTNATATQGLPSTGDISGAKVDEIRVP